MESRRKYFEAQAEEWDKTFIAEDLEILSFLINSFDIREGYKIADLGCGTGILFDILRRKVGSKGLVIGVDFCSAMVRRARINFPFENVVAIDADAEMLPLRSECVDAAISFAAFAHFEHQELVMEEASRILKNGGSFHIIHLLGSQELENYHHKAGGPIAKDHIPPQEKMKELFQRGHFTDVKITDHPGLYLAEGIKG
jgi:demethylmenaquinone methyltransferase/2-methoxy-6-polyprenyl-1,4-benzoquinol methylase